MKPSGPILTTHFKGKGRTSFFFFFFNTSLFKFPVLQSVMEQWLRLSAATNSRRDACSPSKVQKKKLQRKISNYYTEQAKAEGPSSSGFHGCSAAQFGSDMFSTGTRDMWTAGEHHQWCNITHQWVLQHRSCQQINLRQKWKTLAASDLFDCQ